ncbi:MAG TPA: methyltransferase domain-containing protein [Ktedonobacteraceae bacterium]|nr:methyltransferase domain-containing protein [Ktedonobacteraceae bacterium]
MTQVAVLSIYQVEPLLKARSAGLLEAMSSPDLGQSQIQVQLRDDGVVFPGENVLSWAAAEKIQQSPSNCFLLEHSEIKVAQVFSEETNLVCSLYPTSGAPSMLISGFVMHRIKGVDPMQDTLKKVATIQPIGGRVLDTATGLGYTAIEAAKTAEQVVTIEIDPGSQAMVKLNPWSRPLLENPRITQLMGDAFDVVQTFEDASFARIIHDPPAFSLAGQLYSGEFYRQLYRVLQRGGRLFHYIGDLNSKSGSTVTKGALKRLQASGFSRVVRHPEAFGVVAYK